MLKRLTLFLFFTLVSLYGYGQSIEPYARYHWPSSKDFVQSKNYYLLTFLERDKATSDLLKNDAELQQLLKQKIRAIKESLENCKDASCFPEQIKFTAEEIKIVSTRLMKLYQSGNALDELVKAQLIPSGGYILNQNLKPVEFLVKAWEQDAAGINYTIDVYAKGKKPNYPLIDSISFNIKARAYSTLMYDCTTTLVGDFKNTALFFEPAMHAALLYLQINERQDPGNYEPMATTVNKSAVDRVKTIIWSKYPYTHILVPGAGGDNLTSPLSAEGMLRCRLAAQEYHSGKAPFIVVSGGKVHPYKVKYCEAEEMKRYLIDVLGVAENVVIMEPHARHTTTNIRNDARLILKYRIPFNKPGIIVTDKSQTDAITIMATRCQNELKYLPYTLGKRNSETELEFVPDIQSLQINPYEPLDP